MNSYIIPKINPNAQLYIYFRRSSKYLNYSNWSGYIRSNYWCGSLGVEITTRVVLSQTSSVVKTSLTSITSSS